MFLQMRWKLSAPGAGGTGRVCGDTAGAGGCEADNWEGPAGRAIARVDDVQPVLNEAGCGRDTLSQGVEFMGLHVLRSRIEADPGLFKTLHFNSAQILTCWESVSLCSTQQ